MSGTRPRVLFVNRYFYPDLSATSQMLTDLAVDLAARGWEVGVICSRQRYEEADAYLPAVDEYRGVRIRRVWSASFGRQRLIGRALDYLTFYFTTAWKLRRSVGPGDVVVLKTDPPMLSVLGWLLWPRGRVRRVNWLQDLFPEVAVALGVPVAAGPVARMLAALRNRSVRGGAWNVVIGEGMATRLREIGVEEQYLAMIPNWADGAAIRPTEDAGKRLRTAWDLDDAFVVGYSGNLGRAHEFDTVLEAATLLERQSAGDGELGKRRVVFLFIGGGKGLKALREAVLARGLSNVCFESYQPREALSESLQVPDVHWVSLRPELEGCIVPSKFYGILAGGRPTLFVGSPRGELAQVINEHACGHVVPIGDVQGLVDVIMRMRDDAHSVDEMGTRARQLLEARYERRCAVDRWDALLTEVSGAGGG